MQYALDRSQNSLLIEQKLDCLVNGDGAVRRWERMKAGDIPDKVWAEVVLGNLDAKFELLALKFLLSRLRGQVRMDRSVSTIHESVEELKRFFSRHDNIPKASRDLEKIFQKGVVQ
jgi:hypothetical protein